MPQNATEMPLSMLLLDLRASHALALPPFCADNDTQLMKSLKSQGGQKLLKLAAALSGETHGSKITIQC